MNRRHFLTSATLTCGSTLTAGAEEQPIDTVDCHTHFYDPTRENGVPWPGKGTPLYRTVLPADWLKVAAPLGIHKTVVVEASKLLEDNQWILDVAAKEKSIVGFVGHLEPDDVEFAKHLKRFATNPIFRGIRIGQASLLAHADKAGFQAAMKLMADMDLELDINGSSAYHAAAAKLAVGIPALRIVVNHVGGAGDPRSLSNEWQEGMKMLGKQKNVFCKVSALMEQTNSRGWGVAPRETAYYLPVLDHVWNCFGSDRLIYGSNWPVSDKGGPFDANFKIVKEYFSGRGRQAEEKYFSTNSKAAYKWVAR